jgi:hypothetical protein
MGSARMIDVRKTKRTRSRALYVLAPLLCLVAQAPAQAQSGCTPVVYAFRHAEDSNDLPYPHTLTKTGLRHADLYVAMVDDINGALGTNYCPVTSVYTINLTKGDGTGNTTNPFLTAKPLALAKTGADPLATVSSEGKTFPLLEYLGNSPDPVKNTPSNPFVPSYTTGVAGALRETLVATARANSSTAIFWTSQGLRVLAGAIIDGDSKVPQKTIEDEKKRTVALPAGTPVGTPPRTAVYIFPYDATKGGFDDVTKFNQHVQCFNWTIKSADAETAFRADYWCGNSNYGDLGGNPNSPSLIKDADLTCVHARICNTDTLTMKGSAYYGFCPSGVPKVVPPCS